MRTSDAPPAADGPAPAWARPLTGAFLVMAAVIAVHAYGASTNGFTVDDHRFVEANDFVLGDGSWLRAFWDPLSVDPQADGGIIRPLRTLEYRLDHALGGGAALFHWHSVAWHALASVLVLAVLRHLVPDPRAALVGALVWAVHPMQVESVAAVGSRADVAMGACVAAALLCSLRSRGRDRWLVGALLAAALAMLWKETAIVTPLLVFGVRLVRPPDVAARVRSAARASAPFVLVSVAYAAYRFGYVEGADTHVGYRIGGSVAGVFATMFEGFGAYLSFAALPVDPQYDWYLPCTPKLLDAGALAWLAVHLAIVALALRRLRRGQPAIAAAVCLFYGALLPVANWPFDLGIPTTERFLYVPLIGFALLVSHGVVLAGSRRVIVPAGLVVLGLATISIARVPDWHDDDTLFTETLRSHDSVRAHMWKGGELRDLGWALRSQAADASGDTRAQLRAQSNTALTEALEHLDAALDGWKRQIHPWPPRNHVVAVPLVHAANTAFALERYDEALEHADVAIAVREDLPQAHYNRAWALQRLGRPRDAAGAMQTALDYGQDLGTNEGFRFFASVGQELLRSDDHSGARTALEKALAYRPTGDVAERIRTILATLRH